MYKIVVSYFGITGKNKLIDNSDILDCLMLALSLVDNSSMRTILIVDNSGQVQFWGKRVDCQSNWIIELNNPELSALSTVYA